MDMNDIGKCGVLQKAKKIYFPFFLMGAPGRKDAVISWNEKRDLFHIPKKMNYKWFKLIAKRLKENPFFDYDWESFSKNILRPNKEHLKKVLKIDEDRVNLLLSDGFVFLNNFDKNWDDDGEDIKEMEAQGYNYPNFKNFLNRDYLEY